MRELRARLVAAFAMLFLTVGAGTTGYFALGEGRWSLFECFYMTIVTLSTVGYGEMLEGMHEVEHARAFTVALLVFGTGVVVYFASSLTAMIIEGDLRRALRTQRMRKQISRLEDHVIVCGAGSTGSHAIEELIEYRTPTVAIDLNGERLEQLAMRHPPDLFKYIVGDATDDAVLAEANLPGARGVIAAMAGDKDNLFVVVSARQANTSARIVARGSDLQMLDKLKKAGADTVVSPNYIGGLRMVSELLRPQVVRYLDEMRRDRARIRIEEILVPAGSPLVGRSVEAGGLRHPGGVLLLAVRAPGAQGGYRYNPEPGFVLAEGMTLVVQGTLEDVEELRSNAAAAPAAARR